ncbi:hypothetical protein IAD21_04507 [Abditibacteriota bacterium]|nr:hypothetical protein IAD21_04507 [Abditibacteriota bacterium]
MKSLSPCVVWVALGASAGVASGPATPAKFVVVAPQTAKIASSITPSPSSPAKRPVPITLSLPPDPDTPPAIAPLLPPPQKLGNYTLRIIDGGFKPGPALFQNEQNTRPVFFFAYTLKDSSHKSGDADSLEAERSLKLVRISGPDNQMLDSANEGPFPRRNGSESGMISAFHNVRPGWKSLTAEWELLDPKAPSSAKGEIETLLTFSNLPAPQQWDKTIPVNRTLVTPRGTKLTLESVHTQKLPPNIPYKGTTFFSISSTSALGVKATFDVAGVKNDKGIPWKYSGWGKNTEGNVELALNVDTIPDPGAKTMTVTIKVTEKVPALQNRGAYYRFKQEIPVAALFKALPQIKTSDPDVTTLARAESPEVALEVERNQEWDNGGWNGLLWIQTRNPADEMSQWLVRSTTAHSDKGQDVESWADSFGSDHRFWRLNGRCALPNEHDTPLIMNFKGPKPDKVDVEVKLESARRLENWSWLRSVPVPAPGKSLELRDGQVENDYVSVKRVFWFKNERKLLELLDATPEESKQQQEDALAVVVEQTPLFPDAETRISAVSAFDDQDRTVEGFSQAVYGDVSRAGTSNSSLRTLIIPLVNGPKTIDLWLDTTETRWEGHTQTLTLNQIPVK